MPVPKYHELYAPFLKTLKDGSIHTMKEIKQSVAEQMHLTEADLAERSGDYAKSSQIRYGEIPNVQKQIAAAEKAEAERRARIADLNKEKDNLQTELSNLRGLFTGRRRREIEARIEEIDTVLEKLG